MGSQMLDKDEKTPHFLNFSEPPEDGKPQRAVSVGDRAVREDCRGLSSRSRAMSFAILGRETGL